MSCENCGKVFNPKTNERIVNRHKALCHKMECPKCGKTWKSQGSWQLMNRHIYSCDKNTRGLNWLDLMVLNMYYGLKNCMNVFSF